MPNTYSSGDIVHINFPFAEGETAQGQPLFKARPALLINNEDRGGDFIAIAVTGESHHSNSLEIKATDMQRGRMNKASWARGDKLYTVNRQAVQQHMGCVSHDFMQRLRKIICPAVGCK